MVDAGSTSHRIYFGDADDFVVIRENNEHLSHGTTGLSCWQASCHLADLLAVLDMSNKSVVELGAGCGLTGISVASWQGAERVMLTDFDPNVLEQLKHNVKLNLEKKINQVSVGTVDFLNFSPDDVPFAPDLVIGADIVYDTSILDGLSRTISSLLSMKEGSVCIIASALRNPETLASFDKSLEQNGLHVAESARIQGDRIVFDRDCSFQLPQFFPFSASVECPTVIYVIVKSSNK
uniref:FAM86 domain-containing protein n=1 Tax=Steinernema glaseri TaxID=37863 RepID=A0A1I7ZPZ7_9BILA